MTRKRNHKKSIDLRGPGGRCRVTKPIGKPSIWSVSSELGMKLAARHQIKKNPFWNFFNPMMGLYIYIYIYIDREREREREFIGLGCPAML